MKSNIFRMIRLLEVPGALGAFIRWPKFSLAAYQILSRLKHAGVNPATIIDIGANVGQFSVAAINTFPNAVIYPIEPDEKTVQRLRKNVDTLIGKNIKVTAVGERNGIVRFNVNRDSQVSSILPLGMDRIKSFPKSKVVNKASVPLATLDSLFAADSLKKPILVKIDVQGYEDNVIVGAIELLKSVRWVIMEVSFAKLYEGEKTYESIINLMSSCGFAFVRPMNFHTSEVSGEIIEMDALFELRSAMTQHSNNLLATACENTDIHS